MTVRALLVFAACASAQIQTPRIGCYADADNRLRVVSGTAGNFIVSEPLREGVLAAWCADRLVVKTEDALEVDDVVYPAPTGAARFRGALVGFENGDWLRIVGRSIEPAEPPGDDPVKLDGRFIIVDENRIELSANAVSIALIGDGWYRIGLEDGGHMAFSIERLRAYRLPEVAP
jgi:hypothetical protein